MEMGTVEHRRHYRRRTAPWPANRTTAELSRVRRPENFSWDTALFRRCFQLRISSCRSVGSSVRDESERWRQRSQSRRALALFLLLSGRAADRVWLRLLSLGAR